MSVVRCIPVLCEPVKPIGLALGLLAGIELIIVGAHRLAVQIESFTVVTKVIIILESQTEVIIDHTCSMGCRASNYLVISKEVAGCAVKQNTRAHLLERGWTQIDHLVVLPPIVEVYPPRLVKFVCMSQVEGLCFEI